MLSDIEVNLEPLPGYRLIKHLGAGGYGEVWSAEAPGGLTKAIKFVFGKQHEKRASHELRALERIRAVRHPFLLSLERIEIVDGRLLVVTELADASLKDRFDECRKQGMPGIPRDELLGYLRDAADALDFMTSAHALGHLDIKPENLLLMAGHVKVADFGLVKDVGQSQASLVGGMTPLYAAPEVYRGAPSMQSDQYSLAVLYQEMLTGTLPFAGANAADLTLQHLNDEPDLSALPITDHYAASRALSKDPAHRYGSCREFVEALLQAGIVSRDAEHPQQSWGDRGEHGAAGPWRPPLDASPGELAGRPTAVSTDTRESMPTDVFDEDESLAGGRASEQMLFDLPPSDAALVDLPPLPFSAQAAMPVPTLVLGIGGAAGRVLSHLRGMIHEKHGGASALPAVQMLLLDTDARALSDVARPDEAGLGPEETLHLPLRRPQHYREQSHQLLHWLGRRWLYNIPRSMRTEGIRPLGRLALTDHARQAGQRIRRALIQATDADAAATSGRTLGREYRADAAQVYVVASISGGTGSGMSLDLGYAVRAILERLGLKRTSVMGVMLHSTGGDPRHAELARVNAYSWITEFHHFRQSGASYPGDVSCGLPPHGPDVAPFDHTYLVHLGEHLDAAELDQATRFVAEYLHLNVLTPAQAFFEAHRAATATCGSDADDARDIPSAGANQLRSFGVCRRSAVDDSSGDKFAGLVSKLVLENWRGGGESEPPTSVGDGVPQQAAIGATKLVRRLQLDADGLFANSRAMVELHLGMDAGSFLSSWRARQTDTRDLGEANRFEWVDRMFGEPEIDGHHRNACLLEHPAAAIVAPLEEKLRADVRRWVVAKVDDPGERLAGARRAIAWLTTHLSAIDAELERLDRSFTARLVAMRTTIGSETHRGEEGGARSIGHDSSPSGAPCSLLDYLRTRLDQLAVRAAVHMARSILSDARALSDELTALGRQIDQMAENAGRAMGVESDAHATVSGAETSKLTAWLRPRLGQLAAEVDSRLVRECLGPQGGLWTTIMQGGRRRVQLFAKLNEFARQAARAALAGINVLDDPVAGERSLDPTDLRSSLAAATPPLLELGGTRRVLAVLPSDAEEQQVASELTTAIGVALSTTPGADNSLTICVEAGQLPIDQVAAELVQRRRDRVAFAERVHCRSDIQWTSLLPEPDEAIPSPWTNLTQSMPPTNRAMTNTMVI